MTRPPAEQRDSIGSKVYSLGVARPGGIVTRPGQRVTNMRGLTKRLDKLEQQRNPRGRLLVHDTRTWQGDGERWTCDGEPIDPATVTPADTVLRIEYEGDWRHGNKTTDIGNAGAGAGLDAGDTGNNGGAGL